jgi:biotin operon repressor
MNNSTDVLLAFFKALADTNRLKIIGLLAHEEASVEELAAMLEVSSSTVSHHLSKLSEIGLVSARADGYFNIYQLETSRLDHLARQLLSEETLPEVAKDLDRKAYDRKILRDYLNEDGTIHQIPTNQRKLDVILGYIADHFDFERTYTEKEVNAIIGALHDDIAGLRRDLIMMRYLDRERDGSAYWRLEPSD